MKVFIGSDHAGFDRKQILIEFLKSLNAEVIDVGTFSAIDSVDYPDFANLVCKHLVTEHSHLTLRNKWGILICGSGQGMAIRANKFHHIRAALCWNAESAKLAREHNDANVLCLGSRLIDEKSSKEILKVFLETSFAGGRHEARVVKIGSPT